MFLDFFSFLSSSLNLPSQSNSGICLEIVQFRTVFQQIPELKIENQEHIYLKFPSYSFILLSKLSTSSSSALLFQCFLPHMLQWNRIFISQFLISYAVGYIFHQQSVFLSQGMSPSTWRETKQKGQWFLHVFSASGTTVKQLIQVKVSLIFFIFCIIFWFKIYIR